MVLCAAVYIGGIVTVRLSGCETLRREIGCVQIYLRLYHSVVLDAVELVGVHEVAFTPVACGDGEFFDDVGWWVGCLKGHSS